MGDGRTAAAAAAATVSRTTVKNGAPYPVTHPTVGIPTVKYSTVRRLLLLTVLTVSENTTVMTSRTLRYVAVLVSSVHGFHLAARGATCSSALTCQRMRYISRWIVMNGDAASELERFFFDRVEVFVRSGAGGDGAIGFVGQRPAGGSGGTGGSVFIECTGDYNTLSHLQGRRSFQAQRGGDAEARSSGANGADSIVRVPPNCLVIQRDTNVTLGKLVSPGERVCPLWAPRTPQVATCACTTKVYTPCDADGALPVARRCLLRKADAEERAMALFGNALAKIVRLGRHREERRGSGLCCR